MRFRRVAVGLVLTSIVAACGGGGDSSERTRNVALEVGSAVLPYPATNAWPWDVRWSQEAQRAVSYSGDASYEGLFVGAGSVVKTSDPNDESVPAAFPVNMYGTRTAAPDGKGGWYLGGSFLYMDGRNWGKLVHILADGTVDNAFNLDLVADDQFGYDYSAVSWVAAHPNGTDVLVSVSGATSVGGVATENLCSTVYVLDAATGARKPEAEPESFMGCASSLVLVGNRLIKEPGGYGEGVPLLVSIDLITGQSDGFLDDLNSKFPWFDDSPWDSRHVAELEVRGDTLWVFGNLDSAGHRIARVNLTSGDVVNFAAAPVVTTSWSETEFDYAATSTHVMVHVRERNENGEPVSAFHVYEADSGTKVNWNPGINSMSWTWAVREVTVWRDNFLLSGNLTSAGGRNVRGHVTLDGNAEMAASQLPFTVNSMNFDNISVSDFPAEDRSFVIFRGTHALYDAHLTGRVLVTDKDGVPQEFPLDAETDARDISGIGVAGKWLYVATQGVDPAAPMWSDGRVHRFDLVTGKRDAAFEIATPRKYVFDIYGDDTSLVLLTSEAETFVERINVRSVATGEQSADVALVVNGEELLPGEGVVSQGRFFVRLISESRSTVPVAASIDLADGTLKFASGASTDVMMWSRPNPTSKGLMVALDDRVVVLDPATMSATGSIDVPWATDVAEIDGRLIVNGAGTVEIDPATLAVKGPWGPQSFSMTRVVSTGDGAVAGIPNPWQIGPGTVVSGTFGLRSDGTPVVLTNYQRVGKRPPADSPDVVQESGPQVQVLPYPEPLPAVASQVVPRTPAPNVSTQRGSERASILNVVPGDRSVTVSFRPASEGTKHTVHVVGGKQNCSSAEGSCTVKGLTAGSTYRFVVVPDAAAALMSDESVAVSPWVSLKKGSSRKATSLLKLPAKGSARWTVKGAACALKGTSLTAKKKGMCTLTVSVKTKTGTMRSVTVVRVI